MRGVAVGVGFRVGVGVAVGDGFDVGVGPGVDAGYGVGVWLRVGVGVGVGVAADEDSWLNANFMAPTLPAAMTRTIREATNLVTASSENKKCFAALPPCCRHRTNSYLRCCKLEVESNLGFEPMPQWKCHPNSPFFPFSNHIGVERLLASFASEVWGKAKEDIEEA